jgi:hypothetical protein
MQNKFKSLWLVYIISSIVFTLFLIASGGPMEMQSDPRWLQYFGSFLYLFWFFFCAIESLITGHYDGYAILTGFFFLIFWCLQLHQLITIRFERRWTAIINPLAHWVISVGPFGILNMIFDLAPLPTVLLIAYCIPYYYIRKRIRAFAKEKKPNKPVDTYFK